MRTAARAVLHVPFFGWLLRDAIYGLPDAKYFFIANLIFTFGYLTYFFGYAFIIIYALTATALALTALVILTASDLLATMAKRKAARLARGR
ncbi:hypothetical protein V5F29_22975 [Xanthobacter aminoxidans]|uniref:hypothetical protein n=1 Tax=Xanthobacter aminoxidans TaxID=186280 RepID=UPI003729602B